MTPGFKRFLASSLPALAIALAWLVTAKLATAPRSERDDGATRRAFEDIYAHAAWGSAGGVGTSGFGSSLRATVVYRAFLQQFMADAGVRSVVDAGCGDWNFAQTMDWSGIDYKGYDIVADVIAKDRARFAKPNVQFFVADIVADDLPPADLLLCKNVLQHLSNADIAKFFARIRGKYKHVLLTNSVDERTLSGANADIAAGQFRLLDTTRPPFSIPGAKLLTYWDGGNMQQVIYMRGT